jgi:hypothetical protein
MHTSRGLKYLALLLILATAAYGQDSRSFINQEIQTPKWLDINAEARWRSEGQLDIGFQDGNDQNFFLQRLRFGVGIRPASWIYFYGQAQDARAFNAQTTSGGVPTPDVNGQGDQLDLRQAWVDIGHESGWFDIKAGHSWTYGVRTPGTITPAWNYELELIGQNGKVANQTTNAYASEAQFRYQFLKAAWKPSILAEFNFASGDRHPNDGRVNTFDQLYPTNHSPYGFVDAIGRRNTKNVKAGYWIQPKKWLLLKAEGHQFWLESRYDGVYSAADLRSLLFSRVPNPRMSAVNLTAVLRSR